MKMDIDSILYIVITAAILILSGLNSRRKKKEQMAAQEAKAAKQDGQDEDAGYYEEEDYEEDYKEPEVSPSGIFKTLESAAATMSRHTSNPFEKLEQILTDQSPIISPEVNEIQSMEGESMEGVSMEETVDEEEQILEDIRRRQESAYSNDKSEAETEPIASTEDGIKTERDDKNGPRGLPELFGSVDEIKKAVIYSEILNRRY